MGALSASARAGGFRWIEAASLADLRPGRPLGVFVEDRAIALYRVGEGVYATDDRCAHREASLSEGREDGDLVTCPRHGGQFDMRTGAAVRLPPVAPMAVFPVETRGGSVWVGLPADD